MPKQKRIYKCRHCAFKTDEKIENWQHIKVHIRPEKLLACETCQFVTEYKHHLEYHQRKHSGFKPFKCDCCDYQCVNKSMLNSHMKSHSSVYQYQCGDCKYETKYVHSLKMHQKRHSQQTPPSQETTNDSVNSVNSDHCILDLRVNSKLVDYWK